MASTSYTEAFVSPRYRDGCTHAHGLVSNDTEYSATWGPTGSGRSVKSVNPNGYTPLHNAPSPHYSHQPPLWEALSGSSAPMSCMSNMSNMSNMARLRTYVQPSQCCNLAEYPVDPKSLRFLRSSFFLSSCLLHCASWNCTLDLRGLSLLCCLWHGNTIVMSSHIVKTVLLSIIFAQKSAAFSSQPQVIPWSSTSYGPDGPWQAVKVEIGTPAQSVDLLPGGSWMSNIISSSVCTTGSVCVAQSAGVYSYSDSKTYFEIGQTGTVDNASFAFTTGGLPTVFGNAHWMFDTVAVPVTDGASGDTVKALVQNFDMLVILDGHSTLPDGSTYPLTIGKLSLGAPEFNQSWNYFPPDPRWNGTFITSSMFAEGRTPSNSYGMHIGSAALKIPGSLTMGGYDQSRVLGPVSSQPYAIDHLPIDLLDIGIGVADGESPFNFTSQAGLLAHGNSSIRSSMQVAIDATMPYLYLPQSTCDAITENLPVTFQSKYGLYFWDTADPLYTTIVSSSSYLSFTFRLSNAISQNMTIKVPFALLNLTLASPIISTPTQYFPCFPGHGATGRFSLGRAFLQAAFVGVNWQTGNGAWFLAQAPGPNIPTTTAPTSIGASDNDIISSTADWAETWNGFWSILNKVTTPSSTGISISPPANSGTSTSSSESTTKSEGGLSKGALGAVIAVAVVGFISILVAIYLLYRRRKGKQAEPESTLPEHHNIDNCEVTPGGEKYMKNGYGPTELAAERLPTELAVERPPVEMYAPTNRY